MMKKIFMLCAILITCSSCSEFALLASGSSLAASQNTYAKMYNAIDLGVVITTKKGIKYHVYEKGKKYIYNRSTGIIKKHAYESIKDYGKNIRTWPQRTD